jgi:hypothetical protein
MGRFCQYASWVFCAWQVYRVFSFLRAVQYLFMRSLTAFFSAAVIGFRRPRFGCLTVSALTA